MIGATFQNRINQLLSEVGNSTWIDLKSSFDYMYEASKDFGKETKSCHGSQAITTKANTAAYNLNPDFLEIMTKDDYDNYIIQYFDGTNTTWLSWESYSDFLQNANLPGTPTSFAITDAPIVSRITGTATATGNQAGGESVLTDSAATLFSTTYPGDSIVNTLKTYFGIVLSVGTTLTTAMFDLTQRGGAYASWSTSDTYMIQPQPRYQILLDPPPLTPGQTATVTYLAKPLPVYSDYGTYPFATGYEEALIKYATWLYKYRDSKPQMGDPLYLAYERAMRKGKNVHRKAVGAVGFRVNYTSSKSRSWS